jgi:hypothetical protein
VGNKRPNNPPQAAGPSYGHPCIPRRALIQVGAAGLCGLTLPRLLAAEESTAAPRSTARSCIFIVLSGGLSHLDSWDPKPEAAAELRGPYKAISTATPGIHLTEKFPQLARLSNRYCLVRSMSHSDTVHVSAAHTMLTGQVDGTPANDSPMMGSLVAKFRPAVGSLPSHVWLHNMKTGTNKVPKYNSGLSKIGYAYAPLRIGHELDNPSSADFRVSTFDPPGDLTTEQLRERLRLHDALAGPDQAIAHTEPVKLYQQFQQRARELITGPAAKQAFDIRRETSRDRDRYGRHPLGQYLLMARRLVEAGVRLVTVTGWPGLAPGESEPTVTQVWDTHDSYYSDGETMFGNGPYGMQWALPRLDQGLSALLDDLTQRGLLDETLVVVTGEFGRTPKFEGKGNGRGHWPHAYTSLLSGGGVQGGAVYGSSDKTGAYVTSGRPISHSDFGATLFQALGIPPETRYGPDGFSLRVSAGVPLTEIFAT